MRCEFTRASLHILRTLQQVLEGRVHLKSLGLALRRLNIQQVVNHLFPSVEAVLFDHCEIRLLLLLFALEWLH
jgi:hypothetical protein